MSELDAKAENSGDEDARRELGMLYENHRRQSGDRVGRLIDKLGKEFSQERMAISVRRPPKKPLTSDKQTAIKVGTSAARPDPEPDDPVAVLGDRSSMSISVSLPDFSTLQQAATSVPKGKPFPKAATVPTAAPSSAAAVPAAAAVPGVGVFPNAEPREFSPPRFKCSKTFRTMDEAFVSGKTLQRWVAQEVEEMQESLDYGVDEIFDNFNEALKRGLGLAVNEAEMKSCLEKCIEERIGNREKKQKMKFEKNVGADGAGEAKKKDISEDQLLQFREKLKILAQKIRDCADGGGSSGGGDDLEKAVAAADMDCRTMLLSFLGCHFATGAFADMDRPRLCEVIARWAAQSGQFSCGGAFRFNEFTVLRSVPCSLHIDKNNFPESSYLSCLGTYIPGLGTKSTSSGRILLKSIKSSLGGWGVAREGREVCNVLGPRGPGGAGGAEVVILEEYVLGVDFSLNTKAMEISRAASSSSPTRFRSTTVPRLRKTRWWSSPLPVSTSRSRSSRMKGAKDQDSKSLRATKTKMRKVRLRSPRAEHPKTDDAKSIPAKKSKECDSKRPREKNMKGYEARSAQAEKRVKKYDSRSRRRRDNFVNVQETHQQHFSRGRTRDDRDQEEKFSTAMPRSRA